MCKNFITSKERFHLRKLYIIFDDAINAFLPSLREKNTNFEYSRDDFRSLIGKNNRSKKTYSIIQ